MARTLPKDSTQVSSGLRTHRIVCYVVLVFFSILCIFPLYILFINATRSHFQIQKGFSILPGVAMINNFKNVLKEHTTPILYGMRNSLIISGLTSILTTYFSALTAYAIHAYDFKLKKAAHYFILLVMMVPTQVSALGFISMLRGWDAGLGKLLHIKMMGTYFPLIVPSIAAPVVYFFMIQYMQSSLPMEIIEAARIDGSDEFGTFNKIIIPIMKPAIAVQMIFTFVSSWNNYFTPNLVLASAPKNAKTLPIMIATLRGADFLKFDQGKVYMMIALSILPVVVVYLILSKYIVQGVALGSVKG